MVRFLHRDLSTRIAIWNGRLPVDLRPEGSLAGGSVRSWPQLAIPDLSLRLPPLMPAHFRPFAPGPPRSGIRDRPVSVPPQCAASE